jgi:arsenate reductase
MKRSVLFICTHNSARSQMAEGLLNGLCGRDYAGFSAGLEPSSVRPEAVAVLAELGLDISHHRSKGLEEFRGHRFDVVVTVCDSARERCPFFPGRLILHESFVDPAAVGGGEAQRLEAFRRVRDQICTWVVATFGSAHGPIGHEAGKR